MPEFCGHRYVQNKWSRLDVHYLVETFCRPGLERTRRFLPTIVGLPCIPCIAALSKHNVYVVRPEAPVHFTVERLCLGQRMAFTNNHLGFSLTARESYGHLS